MKSTTFTATVNLIHLIKWAQAVAADSRLDWETRYDLVFGRCSEVQSLFETAGLSFDWCDPDGSYQDDVMAYVRACAERLPALEVSLGHLAGTEVNAQLIAAAAQLLDALKTVIRFREGRDEFNFQRLPKDQRNGEYYDKWQEVEATVRAAIAKAEVADA